MTKFTYAFATLALMTSVACANPEAAPEAPKQEEAKQATGGQEEGKQATGGQEHPESAPAAH